MQVLVNGAAAWNTLVHVAALPEPRSQMLMASRHHDGIGGTSAGKAVTLAALGVDVTLSTLLGDDEEAEKVRRALRHDRVRLVVQPARAGRTERHVNLMADDGSRISIYLELPSGPPEPAADVLAALDTADAAVLDLADSSVPLLTAARARGVPVWCDVHDDDVSGYARPFADAADVLLVSADRLPDVRAYLRARVDAGCRLAVCTDGARGAIALDGDGWWEVAAAPVADVVDTNGAGDAFLAGLLAAHAEGRGTAEALAWASAVGAMAVTTTALGAPHATRVAAAALASTVRVARV